MNLDPKTDAALLERTAEILADRVVTAAGGIESLIVLDLATVAQMTGMTKCNVRNVFPVRRVTTRLSGVTLKDIKRHLDASLSKKP